MSYRDHLHFPDFSDSFVKQPSKFATADYFVSQYGFSLETHRIIFPFEGKVSWPSKSSGIAIRGSCENLSFAFFAAESFSMPFNQQMFGSSTMLFWLFGFLYGGCFLGAAFCHALLWKPPYHSQTGHSILDKSLINCSPCFS